MAYKRNWSAVCPRCNKHYTNADVVCKNCGKGQIKAYVTSYGGFQFGCERCDDSFGPLHCSCGATITDKQIHVKAGKGCVVILLIAFIIFVVMPITAFIIGKLLGWQ